MEHSDFGKRFAGKIGIGELMDDLGNALVADPAPLMLGGGNPSHVPPVQARVRKRMEAMLAQSGEFERVIEKLRYSARSQAVHRVFGRTFSLGIRLEGRPGNFALTNGSQNSFFYLFNLFAGRFGETASSKSFSLAPEYIGYSEVGLEKDFFQANRPEITRLANNLFKYQVDFDSLKINEQTGAVCFSRPTNPTGNVVTDEEVERLREGAKRQASPHHRQCLRHALPQHHLRGRPAGLGRGHDRMHEPLQARPARLATGIVIAREETIRIVSKMTSVFSLAPGAWDRPSARPRQEWEITRISREVVRPFYEAKAKRAVAQLQRELEGRLLPSTNPRGPFSLALVRRLAHQHEGTLRAPQEKGVLVVSGHYFFPDSRRNGLTRTNASG